MTVFLKPLTSIKFYLRVFFITLIATYIFSLLFLLIWLPKSSILVASCIGTIAGMVFSLPLGILTGLFVEMEMNMDDFNQSKFLSSIAIGSIMGFVGGFLLVFIFQQFRHFTVSLVDDLLLVFLMTFISGLGSSFYYLILTNKLFNLSVFSRAGSNQISEKKF